MDFRKRLVALEGGETSLLDVPTAPPHGREWFAMVAKDGVAEIHIFDFIDAFGVNGRTFLKDLRALGDVRQINVHVNSPGGDVFEGNTIYNLLKAHKAKVTVYVDGLAASIASVIAMAGDKIVMPKNAMMMIHDPWSVTVGNSADMRKMADVLDKISNTLVAAYQTKSGLNADEIKTIMADETWFTAEEAVAMGFADEVAEEVKIAAAADVEGFKRFKNCPQEFLAAIAIADTRETVSDRASPGSSTPAKKEGIMPDETPLAAVVTAPVVAPATVDVTAAVSAALTAERTRASEIKAAAKRLKIDAHPEVVALVDAMISDNTTIEDARFKIFDKAASIQEREGPVFTFSGNTETFDNPAFRRDAFATAFAVRHSSQVKMTDQAKPYASHSIMDLAGELLRAQGERNIPKDRNALVVMAMHTTSDFPLLLGDVANKLLMPAYQLANPAYRLIAAQRTFNDFKPHKFLRAGDFPNLLQVGEGGEIKQGTISESRELVTMYSYGRQLRVSRQMLVNDDLSAFADMAVMIGRRVPAFENATVFALLAGTGPTMADDIALFDNSTHANYTSSGTAVNLPVELGKMRAKLRAQTSLDGLKLNLAAKYLLVGVDNETAAEQVTTAVTPNLTSSVNRVGPSLTPIVDANISGYAWHMLADPMDAPALIWGSLAGQAGPMVATRQGWDVSGVDIKVERDFGCGAIDYRPITLNAGSAPS